MALRKNNCSTKNNISINEYIKVKYNPYTYEFTLLESSIPQIENSKINLIINKNKEKAFQFWYKEFINSIFEELNSKTFKIVFNGRNDEFLDLKEEVDYLNLNGWNIKLELIQFKENSHILNDLQKYIDKISKEAPEELKKEIEDKKALEEFEIAKNSEAEVSIIATMSSGKSTLLNAILGKEILPSKNEACTATICRIKDNKNIPDFKMMAKTLKGEVISKWKTATSEEMIELNENGNKQGINIFMEGDIPGINSQDMNLILIDTPGPNNSQNLEHKEATYKFIKDTKNNPLVLYVMNATQASTNDDAQLLKEISEIIKTNGKQAEERFIFALNKIDCFDPEKESIETLINNCKDYLKKFGIENPKIFPVSAEAAKLIRLYENKKSLSRKQISDLNNFKYTFIPVPEENYEGIDTIKYASISTFEKEKLYEKAKNSNENDALLIYSGIIAIELYINKYLNKYAKTQKIKDSITTLKNLIDTAFNEINIGEGKTIKELKEIGNKISTLETILATKGKDKIIEVEENIKKMNLNQNVCAKLFVNLENEFTKIENTLSNNRVEEIRARIIIEDMISNLEDIFLNLKTTLDHLYETEIEEKAEKIIEELRKYFIDILGEIKLDNELKILLENKVNLELPSVNSLKNKKITSIVNRGAYTERVKVGERYIRTISTSKWYKPWTWGDEEDIYEDVYENKTFIDLTEIKNQYLDDQKSSFRGLVMTIQKDIQDRIEDLKSYSLSNIDIIRKNINDKLEDLKINTLQQQHLTNEKEIFILKKETIINYKNELDNILNR